MSGTQPKESMPLHNGHTQADRWLVLLSNNAWWSNCIQQSISYHSKRRKASQPSWHNCSLRIWKCSKALTNTRSRIAKLYFNTMHSTNVQMSENGLHSCLRTYHAHLTGNPELQIIYVKVLESHYGGVSSKHNKTVTLIRTALLKAISLYTEENACGMVLTKNMILNAGLFTDLSVW